MLFAKVLRELSISQASVCFNVSHTTRTQRHVMQIPAPRVSWAKYYRAHRVGAANVVRSPSVIRFAVQRRTSACRMAGRFLPVPAVPAVCLLYAVCLLRGKRSRGGCKYDVPGTSNQQTVDSLITSPSKFYSKRRKKSTPYDTYSSFIFLFFYVS